MEMPMRMAAALPSSGRPVMSNDVLAPFQNLPSLPDPQPFAFLPRNVQIPSFGRATAPPPGLCPPPSDPPTAAINSLNCVLPQSLPTHASSSFPQSTKTIALFPCPPPGMANPSFPLPNLPASLRPPVPIPSLPARMAASFISESNLPSSLGAMAQPCCFPRMVTFRAPDHIISSSVRVHEPVLCQPPTNVESLPSTSNSQFPFSKQTNVPFPAAKIARFLAPEINCLLPLRSPAQVPWRSPCPSRSLPAPTLLKAPPKPQNLDMLKNIEILSTFVVRNGHQFEDMAKRFQGADPNFSFLFGGKLGTDASLGCEYYQWRKRALANKTWSNGEFAIQLQQSPVSDGAVTAAPVGSDVDMEDFWHNSFNSKSAEEASARGSLPKKESQKTHRNSDIEQDEAGSRRLQQDSVGNSTVKQVPLSEKGHVLQMSSVTSQVEHECDSRRNLFKELNLQDMKIGKEGSSRGKTKSEASTSRSESTKANGRTSDNGCHSLSKKRTRGQSRYLSCSPLHSKSCYSTAPLQYQRNETHQSIYPNSEACLQLEGEKSSYLRQCLDKKVSSTSKLAILDCEISPDLPVSAPSMNRLSAQEAFSAEPACSFASQFFRSASQGCSGQHLSVRKPSTSPAAYSSISSSSHAQNLRDLLTSALPSFETPPSCLITGQTASPELPVVQVSQQFGARSTLSYPPQPEFTPNLLHPRPPEALENFIALTSCSLLSPFPTQHAALNQARHELTSFKTSSLRSTIEERSFPWRVSGSLHDGKSPSIISPEELRFTELHRNMGLFDNEQLTSPLFSSTSGNCLPVRTSGIGSQRFPAHESTTSMKHTQIKFTPPQPIENMSAAENYLSTKGSVPNLRQGIPNAQPVSAELYDLLAGDLNRIPPHAGASMNMHFQFSNDHKAPEWKHNQSKLRVSMQPKWQANVLDHSKKVVAPPHDMAGKGGFDNVGPLSNCEVGVNNNDSHSRRLSRAFDTRQRSPLAGSFVMDNSFLMHRKRVGDILHRTFPDADTGMGIMDNHSPAEEDKECWSSHRQVNEKTLAAGDTESNLIDDQNRRSSGNKGWKDVKLLRKAVIEYVKSLLKPTWREGQLSREDFKTIAKKAVNRVLGKLQSNKIPTCQDKVDHFMTFSRERISKLVQKYLDKYTKT